MRRRATKSKAMRVMVLGVLAGVVMCALAPEWRLPDEQRLERRMSPRPKDLETLVVNRVPAVR